MSISMLLKPITRHLKSLLYLCCLTALLGLSSLSMAATIKRANVAGTLFLLNLLEEEKFGNGDMVFIILEGQLKTTGTVKVESDGNVYLRPKTAINNLKQGDEIIISHDPIWLTSGDSKTQLVSGVVGSTSGENIFVKIEERFHPVFALNQQVEIQIEENLVVLPVSAIEYRKTGIWFKVTGDVKKLPSGTIVSFPHTQTAGRSISVVSRRLKQGTTSIVYRLGRSAISIGDLKRNDSGYAAGVVATHEVKSSKHFVLQLGAGAEYQNLKSSSSVAGVSFDYELTQFSAVFHGSPQYRIDDKSRVGVFGEFQYGLNGSSNSKSSKESNAYSSQITSAVMGITASYLVGANSVIGFNAGFASSKLTVTTDDGSDSYNGNGNSQILYFAKMF